MSLAGIIASSGVEPPPPSGPFQHLGSLAIDGPTDTQDWLDFDLGSPPDTYTQVILAGALRFDAGGHFVSSLFVDGGEGLVAVDTGFASASHCFIATAYVSTQVFNITLQGSTTILYGRIGMYRVDGDVWVNSAAYAISGQPQAVTLSATSGLPVVAVATTAPADSWVGVNEDFAALEESGAVRLSSASRVPTVGSVDIESGAAAAAGNVLAAVAFYGLEVD